MKYFLALLTVICLVVCLTSCRQSDNKLKVGTNAEFAPFCFVQDGEIVGFEIDVAKEVAQRLHKDILFIDMPFDTLVPSLQLGKLDFIAAGMTPTEERGKKVLFSTVYLEGNPLVAVHKPGVSWNTSSRAVVCLGYTVLCNNRDTLSRISFR